MTILNACVTPPKQHYIRNSSYLFAQIPFPLGGGWGVVWIGVGFSNTGKGCPWRESRLEADGL